MRVAVVELAPGIADADNGLVLEEVRGKAFRPHPGAPSEALIIGLTPPFLAAQLLAVFCGHGEITARTAGDCLVPVVGCQLPVSGWFVRRDGFSDNRQLTTGNRFFGRTQLLVFSIQSIRPSRL